MTPARVIPSTTSHKREPVEGTLDLFARLGWHEVDLNLWPFMEMGVSVEVAVRALEANGQRAGMVSGGWCDFFETAPAVNQTFASVDHQVALARRLGATHLRLFFGRLPLASWSMSALAVISAHLRRLGDAHGDLTFVFENHGRGASGQPSVCAEILGAVDRPNVRMNFDPINAEHAGVRCLDALPIVRPFLAHVHLKGMTGEEYCEFGAGAVDVYPVVTSLLGSGYDGRFTVEYEGPHDKTLRLFLGYRAAVRAIEPARGDRPDLDRS